MRERRKASGATVVVLEEEPVEKRLLEDSRDRLVVAFGVELALVVATADVESKGHTRVALDDGVVELDTAVDQLFRVAPALPVTLAHRGVEERPVLRPVDLDIRAAEANQLLHLPPGGVDDVGQVSIPRRIGGLRLFGVVIGGSLLCAEHRHLARTPSHRPKKRPLLSAHASLPAQRIDHHRALEDQLLSTLVPKGNRPAALTVESFERVDQVAVESVSAELAIGHDIDSGTLLELNRRANRLVLHGLELGACHLAGIQPLPSADQLRWSQEAADDLGSPRHQIC